jgi:hypothetical protein
MVMEAADLLIGIFLLYALKSKCVFSEGMYPNTVDGSVVD